MRLKSALCLSLLCEFSSAFILSDTFKYTYIVYPKVSEDNILACVSNYGKGYIPPKFIGLKLEQKLSNSTSNKAKILPDKDIIELQRIELANLKRKVKKLNKQLKKKQQTSSVVTEEFRIAENVAPSFVEEVEQVSESILEPYNTNYQPFDSDHGEYNIYDSEYEAKPISQANLAPLNPAFHHPLPSIEQELQEQGTNFLTQTTDNLPELPKIEIFNEKKPPKTIKYAESKVIESKKISTMCKDRSAYCDVNNFCHMSSFRAVCCNTCVSRGYQVEAGAVEDMIKNENQHTIKSTHNTISNEKFDDNFEFKFDDIEDDEDLKKNDNEIINFTSNNIPIINAPINLPKKPTKKSMRRQTNLLQPRKMHRTKIQQKMLQIL